MQFVAGFAAGGFTTVLIAYLQIKGVINERLRQDKKVS